MTHKPLNGFHPTPQPPRISLDGLVLQPRRSVWVNAAAAVIVVCMLTLLVSFTALVVRWVF